MKNWFLAAALMLAAQAFALDDDQLPANTQLTARRSGLGASDGTGSTLGRQANGSLLGIDSLVNFSSYFYFPGAVPTQFGDFAQFTWPYTMVGRQPFGSNSSEHTTNINAPIVPVAISLRDTDGSQRMCPTNSSIPLVRSAVPHVKPLLNSPIFQNARYGSSERPTQYTDAIHRAQFFRQSDDDWHTLLRPSVKSERTMNLPRGSYQFAIDANCNLVFVLVNSGVFSSLLFPATPSDTTTIIGGAEHDGDITTQDMSTFLFPDTYLFDSGGCCILGFHSYDLEPGDASNGWRERRYVMNYSSWISPGLFGASFVDVTATSHELMETFSDPFVNNATPIWVAPNGLCQNNLESGDVIEGLPNATFPMTMNGMTYHPQNEALLQWFAGQSPSSAYKHAYSYPDTTVLTSAAVSYFSDCTTPFSVPSARLRP
ncbi:MAG TPA: hypothetical protein VGG91_15335 [Myxococcaceae bacterium]|jgi:hypothetical protein